jgi:thiaminase/transcriptional activator TenA
MASFTDELWNEISTDIYPGILNHPFIAGLTSGDLPEQAFRHYVLQDSAYLDSFGRGLALLAAKSEVPNEFMMFCEHARTTVIVEQSLHQEFVSAWGGEEKAPRWNEMAPSGLLYASYLVRVAYERPYYEGVAAFLPCYWIYRRVGEHLVARGSPNALYQKWIDTYSGEEFGEVVRQILDVVNRLAEPLTVAQKAAMKAHFRRTSQLEYLFWDMGYRLQDWPFAGH